MSLFHDLSVWVLGWAESPFAAGALAFFAFIEAIFFPIPPDPLLITLGVGSPTLALVFAAICSVASVLGGAVGYVVGNKGGKPLVIRLFGEQKLNQAAQLYQKYDVWAVSVAAFTPLPFKLFTLSAGACDLDMKRFLLAATLGRAGRFFLVGSLLMVFGETIRYYLTNYLDLISLAFVVLLAGGFVAVSLAGRLRGRRVEAAEP